MCKVLEGVGIIQLKNTRKNSLQKSRKRGGEGNVFVCKLGQRETGGEACPGKVKGPLHKEELMMSYNLKIKLVSILLLDIRMGFKKHDDGHSDYNEKAPLGKREYEGED